MPKTVVIEPALNGVPNPVFSRILLRLPTPQEIRWTPTRSCRWLRVSLPPVQIEVSFASPIPSEMRVHRNYGDSSQQLKLPVPSIQAAQIINAYFPKFVGEMRLR